ncbi:MAG: aminopeptidase P family N-terminal domain-containing protein [Patescibacteria group bacterium]
MSIKEVEYRDLHALIPGCDAAEKPPVITGDDYLCRIKALLELARDRGLTHLVVYGDREHFANLFYLTGYDPRFEEALLILGHDKPPLLIVGNEGYEYANISPLPMQKELFQSFSLVGQPRGKSKTLREILAAAGVVRGSRVGLVGWKYFTAIETDQAEQRFEIPHYIAVEAVEAAGRNNVRAAADLMLHPEYGLRIRLDLKELVLHEMAGTKVSGKVLQAIAGLRPGMTETEASSLMQLDGEPLAVHPNVNFGARNVLLGLASPDCERLEKGMAINLALGYRRALVARMGIFVADRAELPPDSRGVVEELYMPYFNALATWYESLAIGTTGGKVFEETKKALGGFEKYGVGLNPGHLIQIEEWTNSIFYEGSQDRIVSGMAIQCDIIACPGPPYVGTHVEDGLLIADAPTRAALREQYPATWRRIEARRKMMGDVLGIRLAEEVLPASNIQAVLFPYMADTGRILARV